MAQRGSLSQTHCHGNGCGSKAIGAAMWQGHPCTNGGDGV